METNENMKAKLEQAGQKAEEQKQERRARVVKGSHLLDATNALVNESGLKTKDNTGFLIVFGNDNGRKLAVAKKGGRVDLSGFTFDHVGVTQVTEEEAKEKHLGKVRGQINFDASDEEIVSALKQAITLLQEVVVKETKPKAKKVEEATETPEVEAAPIGTAVIVDETVAA